MKKNIYQYTVYGDYICPDCITEEFTTLSPNYVEQEFITNRTGIKCKVFHNPPGKLKKTEITFDRPKDPKTQKVCDKALFNNQIKNFINSSVTTDFQNSNLNCKPNCNYENIDKKVINDSNKNSYFQKSLCKLPNNKEFVITNISNPAENDILRATTTNTTADINFMNKRLCSVQVGTDLKK